MTPEGLTARTTKEMIDGMDPARQRQLAGIIKGVRGLRFRQDSGRWRLSEDILRQLEHRAT